MKIFVPLFLFSTSISTSVVSASGLSGPMSSLQFLVGSWAGGGSINIGGVTSTFDETESVAPKANGNVLLIQGLGLSNGNVTHDAVATVSFDASTNTYRFLTFDDAGNPVNGQATFAKGVFTWGFQDSSSKIFIRFSITLNANGQWSEIGENSVDQKTWSQFFQMTLNKL